MDTVREFIICGSLFSNIVDSDLGVGDTSAISGLRIWLILLVSIAASWSSSHFLYKIIINTDT